MPVDGLHSARRSSVTRIRHGRRPQEFLLDGPHADEAREQRHAAGLVVGAGRAGSAERLLSDDGARALGVDVEVAGGVAEAVLDEADGLAVAREDGARQPVARGRVDDVADGSEGVGRGVVVDVHDEFQRGIRRRVVDHLGQLPEGRLVDDGAHEVAEVLRVPDPQLLRLPHQQRLELGPDRPRHVRPRARAALLPLELEGRADRVVHGTAHLRARVHQVEVLPARLAHDARVPRAVPALRHPRRDPPVQRAEHGRRPREVQARETLMLQRRARHLLRVPGHELDHPRGQPGFRQDGQRQVVGGHGEGGGLPQHHVAHQRGGPRQVGPDGGEVERGDGVHEALEGAVFDAAGRVVLFVSGAERGRQRR